MATFAKDTHETASIAALIGGTTTYIEMCCPNRNDDALEGYQLWKSKAEGNSACDYTFHMSVTKFRRNRSAAARDRPRRHQLRSRSSSPTRTSSASTTARCIRRSRWRRSWASSPPRTARTRNWLADLQQSLLAQGKTGPEWHEPSRPESVEAEGTAASLHSSRTPAPPATSCIFPASLRSNARSRRSRVVCRSSSKR